MTVESRVPNRAALGAALGQNRPPHSIGITGRIRPEYAKVTCDQENRQQEEQKAKRSIEKAV